MNFPYETEKSYLYGGNCLIMEVNPSVPDKPISKKSRIFASDYQSLKKDSNRLFYIQHDKFRPVNKILKAYDFVKNRNIAQKNIYSLRKGRRSVFVNNQEYPLLCYDNCDPLPAQQDEGTPFEFTLQEVIDLLQQRPNIKRSLNAKPPIQRSIFSSTFPQKVKSGESWEKPHASSRTTGTSFAS